VNAEDVSHTDVAPQSPYATVADLGAAKLIAVADAPNGMPASCCYVCTGYYRAPELLWGASDYTFSPDIWAYGCILVEVLCLQRMFDVEGLAKEALDPTYDALFPANTLKGVQARVNTAPHARPPPTACHLILLMIRFFGTPSADDTLAMNPRLAHPSSQLHTWMRLPPMTPSIDWKLKIQHCIQSGSYNHEVNTLCCEALCLLEAIFKWNPTRRPTSQTLASTFGFLKHGT